MFILYASQPCHDKGKAHISISITDTLSIVRNTQYLWKYSLFAEYSILTLLGVEHNTLLIKTSMLTNLIVKL